MFRLRRLIYRAPASAGVYVQDRDCDGHLLTERYPSAQRQVEYSWDTPGRLVAVCHDWFDVSFSYDDDDRDTVREAQVVSLTGDRYSCLVTYERTGSLLSAQRVSFTGALSALVAADFRYSYDVYLRPVSIEVTVDGRVLPTQMLAYEDSTGRLSRASPFVFDRPHRHRQLTRDVNVEIVREFDLSLIHI